MGKRSIGISNLTVFPTRKIQVMGTRQPRWKISKHRMYRLYLSYARVVYERTEVYFKTRLTEKDLEREVVSPTLGITTTVEKRILSSINDFQHIGQAGYVRGLLTGIGWYGR